ncbi:MAG TPA: hypothetical protein PLQ67_07945 [Burkholderiaceae bacterium]|nr:hypothetical protein [Burkholderiaceae bacterium]
MNASLAAQERVSHTSRNRSGSVNLAASKVKSNYLSVTEQSGLFAGDGGFDIRVQGDTDLIGGAITSAEQAVVV